MNVGRHERADPANQTLTDNGSVSFGTGNAVSFTSVYGSTTVINVTGSLTANGTSFTSTGSTSQLNFTGGARWARSAARSRYTQVSLGGRGPGCGRHVGQHVQLPVLRAQVGRAYLSASPTGLANSNNASFNAIEIEAGSVPSGQTYTLNVIGTATTANLVYVIAGAFTVSGGGSMTVAPNVAVQIGANQSLSDSGSLSFGLGDSVTYESVYGSNTVIAVGGASRRTGRRSARPAATPAS